MRRSFTVVLLVFAFSLTLEALAQGDAEAGRTLWQNRGLTRCSDCHGVNGEGGFGPDLAGRHLSLDQFMRSVRQPWGVMPAYPPVLYSDQELANFHAYLTSLPPVAEVGAWRTPLPPNAPRAQELLIGGFGCAQCHGDGLGTPRIDAGSVDADFDWWKDLVYDHAVAMPGFREEMGEGQGPTRMGNYSRARLPESTLEEMFLYLRDDLGYRVAISSRLTRGSAPGTYNLVVENGGLEGRGLTAENIAVTLKLEPGTTVSNPSGSAFHGVENGTDAVWRIPRLGPGEEARYTFSIGSNGGITGGQVAWHRQGRGDHDQAGVGMP